MLLREKCARAAEDPGKALARLALQHRKLRTENPFYKTFTRIFELPSTLRGGALSGSSFAVKDNMAVSGHPTSFGLLPEVVKRASQSAALVSALQESGAVPFGASNLDELCLSNNGENTFFGRVVNPLDADTATLGSSCGSAAALARGHVDFALGSDFGGSIRLPAAACGVYGFKGSPAFLPRSGALLLSETLDGCGLLTKSLDDLCFILEHLKLADASAQQCRDAVFFVPSDEQLAAVTSEVRQYFGRVVEQVRKEARVDELPAEISFSDALESRKILAIEHAAHALEKWGISEKSLPASAKALLLYFRDLSAPRRAAALCRREEVTLKLNALFKSRGIILTPALPERAPRWSAMQAADDRTPLNLFLALANLCEMPALVQPTKLKNGPIPFAVQTIASPGSDGYLLEASSLLERCLSQLRD